jgi:hypothetical protein
MKLDSDHILAIFIISCAIFAVLCIKPTFNHFRLYQAVKLYEIEKYTVEDLKEKEKLEIKKKVLNAIMSTNSSSRREFLKGIIESGELDKFLDME